MKPETKPAYVIIGIICIILFGFLYIFKINSGRLVIESAKEPERPAVAADTPVSVFSPVIDTEREKIKVHVTGEVASPGVYELDKGSRVDDALRLAGGATEDADLISINMAAYVQDAQQIVVRSIHEVVDKSGGAEQNIYTGSSLVNINTASKSELTELPGIGPVIAGNIIDYREKNGSFKTLDDIKNVNRIGEKIYDGIKDLITVK